MQDRQDEAEVARDRRLPRQQVLDPLLDLEMDGVDLVVEADHLVGEVAVGLGERGEHRPERAHDQVALELEPGLEVVELPLELAPHPNRPVT